MASGTGSGESLALSVHGPVGVLDLVVPAGAAATDVAREYAEQSGLAAIPLLHTRLGHPLRPDAALVDAGVGTGDVLVATTSGHRPAAETDRPSVREPDRPPGPLAVLWFSVAVASAGLAGWSGAHTGSRPLRDLVVALLVGAAVVGVVPLGRYAGHRALAAPGFAAAAALVLVWDADRGAVADGAGSLRAGGCGRRCRRPDPRPAQRGGAAGVDHRGRRGLPGHRGRRTARVPSPRLRGHCCSWARCWRRGSCPASPSTSRTSTSSTSSAWP